MTSKVSKDKAPREVTFSATVTISLAEPTFPHPDAELEGVLEDALANFGYKSKVRVKRTSKA